MSTKDHTSTSPILVFDSHELPPTPSQAEGNAYTELGKVASLTSFRWVKILAHAPGAPRPKGNVEAKIGFRARGELYPKALLVTLPFFVDVPPSVEEGKSPLLKLELVAELRYSLPEPAIPGLTEKPLGAFCLLNAIHIAWPFFRQQVRLLAHEVGFGDLLVPLRRIGPPGQAVNDQVKQKP